jgi:outer membrane protein TolC
MRKTTVIVLLYLFIQNALAQPQTVLPDPLSLDYALKHAEDKEHADIVAAYALQELALSVLNQAQSDQDLQIDIELELAYIEPSSLAINQDRADHRATLKITKPLYDFGRADNKQQASVAELQATRNAMRFIYDRRRIEIARRFFAVILADLKYTWDTETTVVAYVHNDRVKDRHALGEVSDVELFKANDAHQILFQRREVAEAQQRITRAMLAEVLNMPGVLASNLTIPQLEYHKKSLPEYSVLLAKMMRNNAQISLQKVRVEAAHKRLQAARYQLRPTLSAEIEMAEYSRNIRSREDWRAVLNLSFPLLEHAGIKAQVSRQRSNWLRQRATLLATQSQLRQRLYELWQNIQVFKSARQQWLHSMDYSEIKLDQSRVLYEMEIKTDLGNSMVAISKIRYQQAKTDFGLALAWMELLMLLDEDINGHRKLIEML